ncbi:MAG TPA: hypothetical protein VHC63_14195 [Acidimicrobiales bacterium]|nr:hypothetical protein [Acidimicrobiales bacterium]
MNMSNRMRAATAAIGALALACAAALASPAYAATSGDTTTTFTLTAGSLAITAPASANLGSVATGSASTSAQLGAITISDGRGALLGSWTGSVSSTDFTTGGATANETISKSVIDYWSGAATASSGVGTFTPGQLLSANKVALSASRTAFSATVVVGNNSVTWNPTLIVNVPAAAVAGDYTGTVTHSVA